MKLHSRSYMADYHTPVSLYRRLSRESERSFLLESVEQGEQVGRYSFIGFDPAESHQGRFADVTSGFEPLDLETQGLPPFAGGLVGAVTYEAVQEFESIRLRNVDGTPCAQFDDYRTVVAFDHATQQIVAMSLEGTRTLERIETLLRAPMERPLLRPIQQPEPVSIESNFTQAEFEERVERAREFIIAGDAFQIVLSQRFEAVYSGDPFSIYRALRMINPSPYMFYLQLGERSIIGSSPEMLVRCHGRNLEYSPIAGTRKRHDDPDREAAIARELLEDEKERAEHLMLVDLGRNDLGRVSAYGSVEVERFMEVEKFSHVMHLTSRLRGQLRPELNSFDAFRACFPAGTVTGAPKVRAMEIIDELEREPRRFYSGAVGYFDYTGGMDTCIAIRTMIVENGRASWSAGAGIVYDSVPEHENNECYNKGRALRMALSLASQL